MVKIKSNKRKSKTKKAKLDVDTKRSHYLDSHPHFTTKDHFSLEPGQFDPQPVGCVYKMAKSAWDGQREPDGFSKFITSRNNAILEERAYRQAHGGPASYELIDGALIQGVTFGKEKHLKTSKQEPPPGTHKAKKFAQVSRFDWDGFTPHFQDESTFRQSPKRHAVKDSKKASTKRGLYDCFTNPRETTAINNHFGPLNFQPSDRHYNINSNIDVLLHHPGKSRCGKFLKAERFPKGVRVKVASGMSSYERDQGFPGPAHYNIAGGDAGMAPPKAKKKALHRRARSAKQTKCGQLPQPSWMFTSTTRRY